MPLDFNPATQEFYQLRDMIKRDSRANHVAVPLPGGMVARIGGTNQPSLEFQFNPHRKSIDLFIAPPQSPFAAAGLPRPGRRATMKLSYRTGLVLLGLIALHPAQAQDIPSSCLVSFNVKDTTFTTGAATFNCRELEQRRVGLFTKVNALPPASNIDGDAVAQDLAAIEDKVRKHAAEKNWLAIGLDVSGEFLGTMGLAACMETAGLGCALAVVGKATALVGTFANASSEAEKLKQAAELQKDIDAARKKVAGKTSPADKLRKQLVNDFTGLCTDVRKYCVAQN